MWSHCWLPDRFEALDSLLYLFDANVLITAKNTYYPIDQIPEYWSGFSFRDLLATSNFRSKSWKRF
jgi:Domain of unknown function (DUF4411)